MYLLVHRRSPELGALTVVFSVGLADGFVGEQIWLGSSNPWKSPNRSPPGNTQTGMVSTSSWPARHRGTGPIGIGSRAKNAGTAWAPCRMCRSRTPGSSATQRARKCVPESISFKRNDRPERAQEPKRPSPRRLRSRSARKGTSRTMRPSGAKSMPHNGRHRSNNTPTRRSVICASRRYCRATSSSCSIAKNVDIDDNEFRNPAELTKQLREKLPKRPKLSPVITPPCPTPKYRNSCLSWPAPMAAAQALRFLIFTVCRTNEVLGARWTEIDRPRAIWKIPGERMKMDEDHSVPLSDPALAILDKMRDGSQSELIFPSVGDEPHLRTNTRTRRLPLIN